MAIVQTVCGEISDSELGPTLTHEHLICDFSATGGNPANKMEDWELIARELLHFREAGGRSIFEVTPHGLGNDPKALRRISEASEVHIVYGTAFYVEETYPAWVRTAAIDKIADFFISQIESGCEGIRAGLIGELASHNDDYPIADGYRLREGEERVFRAAALAQRRTGVAISTHACLGRGGHAQLDVLENAGADPSRVVIGHCDTYASDNAELDLAYYLPILKRGAYVQFDLIGWTDEWPMCMTDEFRAKRLSSLIEYGHGDQLMISTDTSRLSHLHSNGGRGFDYVWRTFLPLLRAEGVTEESIQKILVENPRRIAAVGAA
jgi:phosphotriesterase-related protein